MPSKEIPRPLFSSGLLRVVTYKIRPIIKNIGLLFYFFPKLTSIVYFGPIWHSHLTCIASLTFSSSVWIMTARTPPLGQGGTRCWEEVEEEAAMEDNGLAEEELDGG